MTAISAVRQQYIMKAKYVWLHEPRISPNLIQPEVEASSRSSGTARLTRIFDGDRVMSWKPCDTGEVP